MKITMFKHLSAHKAQYISFFRVLFNVGAACCSDCTDCDLRALHTERVAKSDQSDKAQTEVDILVFLNQNRKKRRLWQQH